MFGRTALPAPAACRRTQITIPLGKAPRQIDRPKAPIEDRRAAMGRGLRRLHRLGQARPAGPDPRQQLLVGTCGISAILMPAKTAMC